ncbi:unnamed protein product [Oikopleura dioica]|uniref:Uncharacterized protein n=1 Tax=Oikopleura dioica TaxID=34765 RepID=E4YL40_OIKDI|nr:unnamed protein product [Oikopleura dioica]
MNRELQRREVQFLAIVQSFVETSSTAEFIKFSAISSDSFKANLRAVVKEKLKYDIFGGAHDVFYLDDKIEVKLNLLGDMNDFLLWIGCFFDDQLLHLTFKLRLVIRKKNKPHDRQNQATFTSEQGEQLCRTRVDLTPTRLSQNILPTSSLSITESKLSEPPKYEDAVTKSTKPLISNSPLFKPEPSAPQQNSNNDSDDDMEITLQPLEPKKTGLSINKKSSEEGPKLEIIKNELQQVEELEAVVLPDKMLEEINTCTNGDMDKINIIRQFLDLEDEPASYFKEMANLMKLLLLFKKCDWNLDRVMEE